MSEANADQKKDAFKGEDRPENEIAIECCAGCSSIFDLHEGFGFGFSKALDKPEFFCGACYPKVTEQTHGFIEWNQADSVPETSEVC